MRAVGQRVQPGAVVILMTAYGEVEIAVKAIKHGLPDAIRIDGHNPLTLLHDALSEGLHNDSDEDCLLIAETVRLILFRLSEVCAEVLAERRELSSAVAKSRLVYVPGLTSNAALHLVAG